MYFEKILLSTAIACAVLAGGCNFHFREAPENDTPMSLAPSDSGCMSGSATVISDYFNGHATDQEVTSVWDCFSKSLKLFSERTRGAERGIYKPEELRNFLEQYFLNKRDSANRRVITDGLMREFMQLKSTLLGGDTDKLTLDELERLRTLIGILKIQSLELRPYIPLSKDWIKKQSPETIDNAVRTLERAAQALAQPLQKTGNPYQFERFKILKKEFEATIGYPVSSGPFSFIVERMSLVEAFKSLLISPPQSQIKGHEWVSFFTTTARWYGVWIKLTHLKENYGDFTQGVGRERFVRLAIDIVNMLDTAVNRHPLTSSEDFPPAKDEDYQQAISFAEIDAVIDALHDEDLPVPDKARQLIPQFRTSLKNFFRPFVRKMIGGADFGFTGRKAPGLTHGPLMRLADLIEHWSSGQIYLEAIFQRLNSERNGGRPNKEGYPRNLIQSVYDPRLLFQPDEISELLSDAANRMRVLIDQFPALYVGNEGRVSIDQKILNRNFSFSELAKMNLTQELSRVLMAGYATDSSRAQQEGGLNFDELFAFFDDIFPIGRDIRLFDPERDNKQMIGMRFLEGNLFTFASNGGDLMDLHEGGQLMAYLLSIYQNAQTLQSTLFQALRSHADLSCRPTELDTIGEPAFNPVCFRREYFKRVDQFWSDIPDFLGYYHSLPDTDLIGDHNKASFRKYLEVAARLKGYSSTPVVTNDLQGFAGVVYYVESLIQRFDRNHDGSIDQDEADTAFPIFKDTLKKMVASKGLSGAVPDNKLRALFTYLLKEGAIPNGFLEKIEWLWWSHRDHWTFAADRLQLLKIFALLSASTPGTNGITTKVID